MRTLSFIVLAMVSLGFADVVNYDDFFTELTMRVDYHHSGTSTQEFFGIDKVYQESEWPGSKVSLIDTLNYGMYLARVYDVDTAQLIYSFGFSSIFGEWQTTDEALKGTFRTMHESVRLPMPKRPVLLSLCKRNKKGAFQEMLATTIDPNSRFINRERSMYDFKVNEVMVNGKPEHKVDILIIADGYKKSDLGKFRRDVKHYTKVLFAEEPFKARKNDFNVRAVESISRDSGVDEPRKNIWKRTIVDAGFNTFDLARYVLSTNNKAIRDVAALAPYDHIYILFNSPRYGGGGIYHCQATCYTGAEGSDPGWWRDYVFVHEFGHSFAGLADEYYSSNVAYNDFYPSGVEPWEPNITNLVSFDLKWEDQLPEGSEIPTHWAKVEYDSLRELYYQKRGMERKRVAEIADSILHDPKIENVIGVYQGAGYASEGMYRPATDCRMFSKSLNQFCPVCQQAINRKIDFEIR